MRPYLLCDMIPNGIPNLPEYKDTRYECLDCGKEISLASGNMNYCELRLWTKGKPNTSDWIANLCHDCTDRRSAEALEQSYKIGRAVGAYIRRRHLDTSGETYGGVRVGCDGKGGALFGTVKVLRETRLASGDTRRYLSALDGYNREWRGYERDGYVSFKPYGRKRA